MRCARRLPCGHTFHALCLRRWLEQDSSCAICRKALALNLTQLIHEAPAVEDADPTLQYVFETLSPQNGHLSRLWNRLIFASFSDEQVCRKSAPNRGAEQNFSFLDWSNGAEYGWYVDETAFFFLDTLHIS